MSDLATMPRANPGTFSIVVGIVVAVCALPMLALLALQGAPTITVLAVVAASLPVAPLVAFYLWLDRYEPEPRRLLVVGLGWGAVVATAGALFLNGVGGWIQPFSEEMAIVVVAPITEEFTKGLFLFLMFWWRRDELDGILDGIVYAGMVGIGFAFVENILYLVAAYNGTSALSPGGVEALTQTFILRCVFSPFAHPLFTSMIGIGVGLAVWSRSRTLRLAYPLAGYGVAVGAHALWNGSSLFGLGSFVLVYVVIAVPALLAVFAFAIWVGRGERTMLDSALRDAGERGLFPPAEILWIVDMTGRRMARQYAKEHGGPGGKRSMVEYQRAAVELGYLHARFLRGVPPPNFQQRGQAFLTRLAVHRPHVQFPREGAVR